MKKLLMILIIGFAALGTMAVASPASTGAGTPASSSDSTMRGQGLTGATDATTDSRGQGLGSTT